MRDGRCCHCGCSQTPLLRDFFDADDKDRSMCHCDIDMLMNKSPPGDDYVSAAA